MEQGARIELALSAWKAEILPLNEPRIKTIYMKIHANMFLYKRSMYLLYTNPD